MLGLAFACWGAKDAPLDPVCVAMTMAMAILAARFVCGRATNWLLPEKIRYIFVEIIIFIHTAFGDEKATFLSILFVLLVRKGGFLKRCRLVNRSQVGRFEMDIISFFLFFGVSLWPTTTSIRLPLLPAVMLCRARERDQRYIQEDFFTHTKKWPWHRNSPRSYLQIRGRLGLITRFKRFSSLNPNSAFILFISNVLSQEGEILLIYHSTV